MGSNENAHGKYFNAISVTREIRMKRMKGEVLDGEVKGLEKKKKVKLNIMKNLLCLRIQIVKEQKWIDIHE